MTGSEGEIQGASGERRVEFWFKSLLDLFDLMGAPQESGKLREKRDRAEAAMDALRQRMGNTAVTLGVQQNEEIGVRRGWKKKGNGE